MATTPIIVVDDITAGTLASSASPAIPHPAYVNGDLLLFHLAADNPAVTITKPASGPNGETIVSIRDNVGTSGPTISVWYFIGSATTGSGTQTATLSVSDVSNYITVIQADGAFNSTTPIDSSGIITNNGSNVNSAAWTATADAADGLVTNYSSIDRDPVTSSPAGWTDRYNVDEGAMAHFLSTRDTAATTSEAIATASWTISGDDSTSVTYILNAYGAAATFPYHVIKQIRRVWKTLLTM